MMFQEIEASEPKSWANFRLEKSDHFCCALYRRNLLHPDMSQVQSGAYEVEFNRFSIASVDAANVAQKMCNICY